MKPLTRKAIRIGRAQRELRDDRIFVVATEDTYAPQQYFEKLSMPRVKVIVLSTPPGSGLCAPEHVVERLKNAFDESRSRNEIQTGDEFWVLIDTDHHIEGTNLKSMIPALRRARQSGFELAISNPCFELWLLLHHAELPVGKSFANCDEVAGELRTVLGMYNKTSIRDGAFELAHVPNAIARARALESRPDDPEGPWPGNAGTRVYRLFESALGRQAP